jgi:glycerophosphoryl diester phosphodiesterase
MLLQRFLTYIICIPCFAFAQQSNPLVIAHRGASGYAPENTLASVDAALELAADVIEVDVHQTKDGVVVVMHDEKLDRTTNMSGLIKDYNWNEIKDADAGSWFSAEFSGQRIPMLEDVIARISGKSQLLIEIKKGGDFYPGIERKVFDIIKAAHAESWCMIQSFSGAALSNFLQLNSGLKVYKLALRAGKISKYPQAAGLNPNHNFVGKQTFVWTVNDEKDMKRLVERGADGIISNYPDKVMRVVGE